MPAIAAAPLFYGAIATGAAGIGTGVIAARAQSGASRRATEASDRAAARAEAFERDQDEKNRADAARLEAEDRRRWDVEQQNIAAQKAENDARQQYEDKIRYQKMVNLAQLTGGPRPEPLPNFGGGTYQPQAQSYASPGAPIMSRPSTANAMIAPPNAGPFDPFAAAPTMGMPLASLNRSRRIV